MKLKEMGRRWFSFFSQGLRDIIDPVNDEVIDKTLQDNVPLIVPDSLPIHYDQFSAFLISIALII